MKLNLLLSFTCLFFFASAGHIYPHDILLSPNNIDSVSDLTLIFTLDTSLAPTDYLRIVLPFQFTSIQSAFWDTYVNCSIIGQSKRAIVTPSTIPSDTNTFFVQFFIDLVGAIPAGLLSNTTYFLTIKGTPVSASPGGIFGPFQLSTVSDNQEGSITYDSNSIFGSIALAAPYPSTLGISLTIPTASITASTTLGADYTISIDIKPTITIKNQARIDITLTNPDFSLLSCKSFSVPKKNLLELPASFQPLSSNSIRATVSETFVGTNQAQYHFECIVKNPVSTATTDISVTTWMGHIDTIVESGLHNTNPAGSFSLQAVPVPPRAITWDETFHQVLLGWGYSASSVNSLPLFTLYKDANPTERWYQSVKTVFKPRVDLSTTEKLQVVISTVEDAGFTILAASIYHNLPDFSPQEKVTCQAQATGSFTCQNVGQLQAQQYFVSFRFNIPSTVTATVASDFGKVLVQTQAASTTLIPLSVTTLINSQINSNMALFGSTGIIASSTTVAGSTTTPYVTNNEDIILTLTFNYFTNQAIPVANTNEINMGIEFYTSNALQSSDRPACTINTLTDQDIVITDCGVDQQTEATRLRFRIAAFARVGGGTPPGQLFTAAPSTGSINFNKVFFGKKQFSSLNYVSENTFDYYARWVQGFTAVNPSLSLAPGSSPFFFNSLVYSNGGLSNVQVGTTFFATGPEGNLGVDFPTLVRITGYLVPDEQESADRLLLFFNDLEPLDTENPCFGPMGLECSYQVNGLDNTQTNSLTDYSGSRVIEINTDLTQRFNIYIPVRTTTGVVNFGYFLATAKSINSNADSQKIFASMYSKRVPVAASSSAAFSVADGGANTPTIDIPADPVLGTTINTNITNIQGAYLITTPNTATTIGAAYGICGDYDFISEPGFALQPFYTTPTTPTPEQYCVSIEYLAEGKQVYCEVCPVHSAMQPSNASLTNFKLPSQTGADFLNFVYITSSTTGDLQNAVRDNQVGVLSPLPLSNLNLTFIPLLKKASRNIYANLTFNLQSPLPKNIQINIAPSTPSTSLIFSPITTVPCEIDSIATDTCSVTGSATGIQIDAIATDSAWPPMDYSIRFMIDSEASSITSDTEVEYLVTILVDGSQPLTAVAYRSEAQAYTVINEDPQEFVIRDLSYFFGSEGARSIVSFTFDIPSDLVIYSSQQITFNLGSLASTNLNTVAACLILNATTNQVSNDFLSCDASDLSRLTLQPKDSVSGSYIVKLHPLIIPAALSNNGITATIQGVDGTTTIISSNTLALLTPSSSAQTITGNNVNIRRLSSNPGSVSEFTFEITPSVNPITLFTDVFLYFPAYYSEKLGYRNIWCTANDIPVSCFIADSRLLKVTFFETEIPVGTSVQIRIYGINTPQVPVPPGNIFIGITSNEDAFTLDEMGVFEDVESVASTPARLFIEGSSLVSNVIRESTNYSLVFTTDSTGISRSNYFTMDFPDAYEYALWNLTAPFIQIKKTSDQTVLAEVQSTLFGSRLKLPLPIDLEPMTSYTFLVKNIRNPDYPTCKMDRPTISIAGSSQLSASLQTVPNTWDSSQSIYITNKDLKTLNYFTADGQQVTTLTLPMGVYSPEIRIMPPNGEAFSHDMILTPILDGLSIIPSTLRASQGSPYVSFKVGASTVTPPRNFLLGFEKSEGINSKLYSDLPILRVIISDFANELPVNTIRVVRGGTSLPYFWDLTSLGVVSLTNLEITSTVENPFAPLLSTLGPSNLVFNPSSQNNGFHFILKDNALASNPPSFDLYLSGEDSRSYRLGNTNIQIEVVEPNTNPPVISNLQVSSVAPTRQMFSLQTDQIAGMYWHVALDGYLTTTDCLRIRENAELNTQFDSKSWNQEQYGSFFVYNENQQTQFEIGNLLSNEKYSYVVCPINQLEVVGVSQKGSFQTSSNKAELFVITAWFTRPITKAQLASLVCLFSQDLQLPNLNVVAMDGTTCSVPTQLKNLKSFNYSQPMIYVSGDRYTDKTSTSRQVLDQYIQSIRTRTPSTFLTQFNKILQTNGISTTFQTISLQAGPIYPLPAVSSRSEINSTSTDTTITISGISLSSGGVIYGVASPEEGIDLPTQWQIRQRINSSNYGVASSNALYSNESVSLVFSDLEPETNYTVYYYASSNDRTQYARVTTVSYVQTQTIPTREILFGSIIDAKLFLVFILMAFVSIF